MSNTIDNNNPANLLDIANAQNQKSRKVSDSVAEKGQSVATSNADTVSITASAQKIASLEKAASNTAEPFDQSKVDEIKAKISNGEYQVDANKVADKLLEIDSKLK